MIYNTTKQLLAALFMMLSITKSFASDPTPAQDEPVDRKNLSYAATQLDVLPLYPLKFPGLLPDTRLIFVHTPKVGGTGLTYIAKALLETRNMRCAVPRVEGQSPNLIYEGWVGGLAPLQDGSKTIPKDAGHHFISGHFPYGAHAYISDQPVEYIALIRNPLEREVSGVNFDFQRGYVSREETDTYLMDRMLDNPQTRALAGAAFMYGECTQETLDTAKENLSHHFLFAGVTEDADTFYSVVASVLKLEPVAMVRSQVTGEKAYDPAPEELIVRLKEKHKFDLALYAFAKEQWELFKETYLGEKVLIAPDQKVLSILPQFALDNKPEYMTLSQIAAYNEAHSKEMLVQVSQTHHGVDTRK